MRDEEKAKIFVFEQWASNSFRHVAPFIFGPPPPFSESKKLNVGSVLLMEGLTKAFGVTCAHCVDQFRVRYLSESDVLLRIGDMYVVDLESRIIDYDKKLDLCTFEIKPSELKTIRSDAQFLTWHPPVSIAGKMAALIIGFPKHIVKTTSETNLHIGSISVLGNTEPENIGASSLVIELDMAEWVFLKNPSRIKTDEIEHLGGLSGCPIFLQNGFNSLLGGIVYESPSEQDGEKVASPYVLARYNVFTIEGKINREYEHTNPKR